MMMSPPAILLALVIAALSPSDALLTPSFQRSARYSSAQSYSSGGNDDDPPRSSLPRSRSLRRLQIGSDFRQWHQQHQGARSTTEKSVKETIRPPPRPVPRRAMPHVRHSSRAESAASVGYIIQQGDATAPNAAAANEPPDSWKDLRRIGRTVRVRPLRTIRRIVHRSQESQLDRQGEIRIEAIGNKKSVGIRIISNSEDNWSRLLMSSRPQIDELVDKTDKIILPNRGVSGGARRVTFKATREASKPLTSKPIATLTEYMTQPVSQYSLLSFHDAEGLSGSDNYKQPVSRRWHVRRLTKEEARNYIDSASSSDEAEVMEESNLFRLAVPLLPLIGWDLTPVIDLEVIPPKNNISLGGRVKESSSIHDSTSGKIDEAYVIYETSDEASDVESTSSSKWAPLRGIRKRMNHHGHSTKSDVVNSPLPPPVVRIRSLKVSLLSTQREVSEVMSRKTKKDKIHQMRGSNMQKEAIEIVGKVEEWLKPHITFEAELSWNDGVSSNGAGIDNDLPSTVTVKSTAITSLTIPKIPSDIIRKSVPSEFLVKRLGATLTSRALAVCLPRFLNQLEKDYNRWSKV
ncbi:hypothetical protein ACHAXA_011813 [Cyclostephanos tholiformis]|uniref:Uncharacterized protein n=1 Tax=Cyclostephanos tholiformis TaxID=382380 RepID=A0ABD3RAQ5_9STRA